MSVKDKHNFEVQPLTPESDVVKYYVTDHLAHYGYPPDTELASQLWFGITRKSRVWGVVGIKPLADKIIEVPDFLFHRSRWGYLAAYAALEIIRDMSKDLQLEIITATPVWNTKQMKAQERVFGVSGPTHHVYRFKPWEENK